MKRNQEDKNGNGLNLSFYAIISFVIISGLWLLTFYLLKDCDPIDRGTFGDMFGSVNALFSGLALAGIILTIVLQTKELSLQRQELKDTRDELKRAADAQVYSGYALVRQADNLKISAKLSALSALVRYYSDQENRLLGAMSVSPELNYFREQKEECVRKIEEILRIKEQD